MLTNQRPDDRRRQTLDPSPAVRSVRKSGSENRFLPASASLLPLGERLRPDCLANFGGDANEDFYGGVFGRR